jgi:hypothetical protein
MTRDEYEQALFRLVDEFHSMAMDFSEKFWNEPSTEERKAMIPGLIADLGDMTQRVKALSDAYGARRR